MKVACPRVIRGNRGDLLSRYGILAALQQHGLHDVVVFCDHDRHIRPLPFPTVGYGALHNLLPTRQGLDVLRRSDAVFWTAGLDLQDDASLFKLQYLLATFTMYRLLGLKIVVLMQGAGPLRTLPGRLLARTILSRIDAAIVRDVPSLQLLRRLNRTTRLISGYDGIFLEGLGEAPLDAAEQQAVERISGQGSGRPCIGFNLRLWFHFASSIIPYRLAKQSYIARSEQRMAAFVQAGAHFVASMRRSVDARVVLLSMYEPDKESWEDDSYYLRQIKAQFAHDEQVVLVEQPLTLHAFCKLMAALDLVVGARLHATLTAMRFGVPALNLNYTLKGRDIYTGMGLAERVLEVEEFIANPDSACSVAERLLHSSESKRHTQHVVRQVIAQNQRVLGDFLQTELPML
jgi:polysaccharide pyruvyl transferase WcaK-like protein